ncbi:MAG: PAS domain S-box protein [Verrucomicrobiaceae bacterium]|nr:MAG: PAS domain S-box protein [Verrucomicrobiaceae bacterium]
MNHSGAPISLAGLPTLHQRSLAFDGLADGVILTDPSGVILDWSSGAEAMFGWSREEVLGKTPAILHRPEDAPILTDSINAMAIRNGRWSGEITFVRKDGTTGVCETTTVPLHDEQGQILATVGINKDITARKRAEAKLLEEQRFLREVIDLIPDPIFFKDTEGRQILQNVANAREFGLAVGSAEGLGKTAMELAIPREFAAQYAADDQQVLRTGQPLINREEPYRRSDGSSGWLLTSKYPIRNEEGTVTGLLGICRDITSFKQAAGELDATRRRLLELVENSPLALIEWTPKMAVRLWSGRASQMFGWNSAEVVDVPYGSWAFVHPNDQDRVNQIITRLLQGVEDRNVCVNRNLTKTGEIVHSEWHNSALRNPNGEVVAILSLIEDITERVQAEAERAAMERKLQEAQKLESLGVLAGGIAHDFNNLLTAILGHASLAAGAVSAMPHDEGLLESLTQIESAALRAAELCNQMLAYSGKGQFFLQELDLNTLLSSTTELLRVSISKKATLNFSLAPGLPRILGDATQIRQVFMNLIINASEAIDGHNGMIDIRTMKKRLGAEDLQKCQLSDATPGEFTCLEVSDTGTGMSPEVISRIFDPFFTTKFTGRGLGLAAVMGIVRSHSGALSVSSMPGCGTSFSVYFPALGSDSVPFPPEVSERQAAWKGSGTVLVIDDEESVRKTLRRMLELLGFNVLTAPEGASGLAQLSAPENDDIRLVMLDLVMPQLDGQETYRILREINPDVPVLLISGYTESEITRRFGDQEVKTFLQKPFQFTVLRERLREILG